MSWPTIDDLEAFLQTTIADGDPTATLLLDLARALVRAEARQTFDVVADDVLELDGNGRQVLLLPELPVLEVKSVALDGDDLVDGEDYDWSTSGVLRRLGASRSWGVKARSVVVTYDHGFDPIPDDVRLAVLSVAGRAWSSPTAVAQETLGGYSVTYISDPGGVGLGPAERTIAARYRAERLP